MLICHIENELGIVDVEVSVEVANKSPIQTIPCGVFFECVELVANLLVDVFALAVAFAALRFDNPDASVFLHNDVIGVEEALLVERVEVDVVV